MKQKSLRQLAKELGVSHSYLSQVIHGKRPASDKVALVLSGNQMVSNPEAKSGTLNPPVAGSTPARLTKKLYSCS